MLTHKGTVRWWRHAQRYRAAQCVALFGLLAFGLLIPACSSKHIDPRTLLPADPFVFLEARDLGAALRSITESPDFKKHARSAPDLTPLDGVSVAIAVTGFETKEAPLSDEGSELRIQPHFVAVAETNVWNFQTISFTEEKIGNFVNDIYGGEINLEMFPRYGGQYFVWTSPDGRKAYALVAGSIIYFSNDESSIEKCVAVRDGKEPSLASKIAAGDDRGIASGFVSKDGLAQLAGILGIKIAHNAGQDADVQSAVAGIVPKLISNSVTGITWSAARTESGIEDEVSIALVPGVASILKETLAPADPARIAASRPAAAELPAMPSSVTRYAFNDPRIAWRSLLLTAQKQLDPASGNILARFSSILFEPYGVRDPEAFLAALSANTSGAAIFTVRTSDDDDVAVLASPANEAAVLPTLSEKLVATTDGAPEGISKFSSADGEMNLIKSSNGMALGSPASLSSFRFGLGHSGDSLAATEFESLLTSRAPIITISDESARRQKIVSIFTEFNEGQDARSPYSVTETRFDETGIKRKVTSQFGLIGSILEEFFASRSEPDAGR